LTTIQKIRIPRITSAPPTAAQTSHFGLGIWLRGSLLSSGLKGAVGGAEVLRILGEAPGAGLAGCATGAFGRAGRGPS
jgi:hypothetical protein